ncbi:MAG: hypothetical protein KBI47_20565, partial [Armatimonadetes bacterium]|nr:hypothetical protein [Armatimonadota bacterium]
VALVVTLFVIPASSASPVPEVEAIESVPSKPGGYLTFADPRGPIRRTNVPFPIQVRRFGRAGQVSSRFRVELEGPRRDEGFRVIEFPGTHPVTVDGATVPTTRTLSPNAAAYEANIDNMWWTVTVSHIGFDRVSSGDFDAEARSFFASLSVDGNLVGSAHAPGGGQGCAGMGPVVSDPPPPQQVLLTRGVHTLTITASTNDPLYHFGAWYRFDLTFEEAP